MAVVYVSHKVLPLPRGVGERGTVALERFVRQLAWLRRLGVTFVRMSELAASLRGECSLPRRAGMLALDDGYSCVADHVVPLLEGLDIPLTVFVVPGLVGKESHFYVGKGGRPARHMGVEELRGILETGLVEIGANGFDHLDLTTATDSVLARETAGAKQCLEEMLKVEVPYYAYPFGRFSDRAVEAVKRSGYGLAFTTRKAKLRTRRPDLWRLPRVTWGRRATVFKLFKYHILP